MGADQVPKTKVQSLIKVESEILGIRDSWQFIHKNQQRCEQHTDIG